MVLADMHVNEVLFVLEYGSPHVLLALVLALVLVLVYSRTHVLRGLYVAAYLHGFVGRLFCVVISDTFGVVVALLLDHLGGECCEPSERETTSFYICC